VGLMVVLPLSANFVETLYTTHRLRYTMFVGRDRASRSARRYAGDRLTGASPRPTLFDEHGVYPVWFHLKFAALVSLAWVVLVVARPSHGASQLIELLPGAFWVAFVAGHVALAAIYWWGSLDPPRRLVAVYVGLATFALRAALGIYLVLYVMEGDPAMIVLVEMVLSIGLFSALVNALPGAVRPGC